MMDLGKSTFGLGTVLVVVAVALTLVAPGAAATAAPAETVDDGSVCFAADPWAPYVYVDPDCGGPAPPVSAPPEAPPLA